jgi:adenylate cyclase class 2
MREVELKGAIHDEAAVRSALQTADAHPVFRGSLVDRRYDTPDYRLQRRDEVLRLRITRNEAGETARLDLKGPASYPAGFKVRDEIGSEVRDPGVMEQILDALGLRVTREIEREVEVFDLDGAIVRLERYPRMDLLAEVEGDPAAIERAIAALGMRREDFTSERLADFVRRYESRTGQRAALCGRELAGDYRYRLDDA